MVCSTTRLWIAADSVVGRHPHAQPLYSRPFAHPRTYYPWHTGKPGGRLYPAILNPNFLLQLQAETLLNESEPPSPKSPGAWSDTSTLVESNYLSPKLPTSSRHSPISTFIVNEKSDPASPIPNASRSDITKVLMPSSTKNASRAIPAPIPLKGYEDRVSHLWSPESSPTFAHASPTPSAPPTEPLPPVPTAALRLRAKSEKRRRGRAGTCAVHVDKENQRMF
ncbi:hypothetical protein VKT23_000831 [Stygiomarasmius scandens]|uniref:Uncharacterized protein n=1 Tax=Marasmiellus scandens TaxID=2682957 RepID=A0ABR1K7P2_9AGAR